MRIASFIFIVASPAQSAEFYRKLLEMEPAYQAENFAQFNVTETLEFGLWAQFDSNPTAQTLGGGAEICFNVDDADAVYARAQSFGFTVLNAPQNLDFGRTVLIADPDGYRVRFIQELP